MILHVVHPARFGGLETVVAGLAAGHARAGHSVHVAAVTESAASAEQFVNQLPREGVRFHSLVVRGRSYLRERRLLKALFRSVMPSVVHTHGYRADIIAGSAARAAGVPTVTTVHGFTGGGWRNRVYEKLQLRAINRSDAVVAVSRPLAELLSRSGVPSRSLHVIVNAWSPRVSALSRAAARARLGLPTDARCVGWVGRLSREKGPDVLLESTRDLPDDVVVSFIGDGPERPAQEERHRTRERGSIVKWHGAVDDAAALLGAFDVFVLSSRTEGTPMVLLEAMAAGTPIVATRVGGVPDVVSENEAILVSPADPSALAAAIRQALDDRPASARRAAAAKERLKTGFARDPWIRSYADLYQRIGRPSTR